MPPTHRLMPEQKNWHQPHGKYIYKPDRIIDVIAVDKHDKACFHPTLLMRHVMTTKGMTEKTHHLTTDGGL